MFDVTNPKYKRMLRALFTRQKVQSAVGMEHENLCDMGQCEWNDSMLQHPKLALDIFVKDFKICARNKSRQLAPSIFLR